MKTIFKILKISLIFVCVIVKCVLYLHSHSERATLKVKENIEREGIKFDKIGR
jgi:hypothetical protein